MGPTVPEPCILLVYWLSWALVTPWDPVLGPCAMVPGPGLARQTPISSLVWPRELNPGPMAQDTGALFFRYSFVVYSLSSYLEEH